MGAAQHELPGQGSPRFLERVATTIPRLRARYSETATYPYASNVGNKLYELVTYRLPSFLRSPNNLSQFNDQIRPFAEMGRDILLRIENPREQLRLELGAIADRVNALVAACDNPEGRRRNQNIDQFQTGFVHILEDVINGTNADGKPNEFRLLRKAANAALQKFPELNSDLFTRDAKGRKVFRTDQELPQVANLRKGKLAGLVNKALPVDNPLTPHRAVAAVSVKLAQGLVGGYRNMEGIPVDTKKACGESISWLVWVGPTSESGLNRLIGVLGTFIPTMKAVKDYLKFVDTDLPMRLPSLVNLVPDKDALPHIGSIISGAVGLGATGLKPLLELPQFNVGARK